MNLVQSKIKPSCGEISGKSEVCKYYWVRFDSLVVKNGILYHKWEGINPENSM
jgi:hypothetical protein